MTRNPLATALLVLATFPTFRANPQTPAKNVLDVYLTSDCNDTVGGKLASALREKIRSSAGYSVAAGSTKGHSGYEIILTCAPIPGHETSASAISYVFTVVLPDQARYFVQPGIAIVGSEGISGSAQNIFSQLDNWADSAQKAMSK